jgi:hypothetical protein
MWIGVEKIVMQMFSGQSGAANLQFSKHLTPFSGKE